jgi:membrane-associated protease RseP (regulator of RpoE activity)
LAAAPASAVAGPSNDPWSATQSQTVEKFSWSTSRGRLGVMVMSLTPELRKYFGAPDDRGVLVAHVEPGMPAAKAGIEVGDVIVEVRGRTIDAAPDVLSALTDLGKGEQAKIAVVRAGKSRSLDATLADNATTSAPWSPPRLRDWMKLWDAHHAFSTPNDEPTWFRDWLKPLEPTKHDRDSAAASNWLRKLRELFEPKNTTPTGQRS